MKNIFYDVNEAIDFARSVGAVNIDRFCSYELQGIGRGVTHLGIDHNFDIDGFSDVKPLIYVYHGYEESCYNEIKFLGYALDVAGYGKFYISNQGKDKYGLSSIELLDVSYNTFAYFNTELEAPQNIGKVATRTKITNWAEYSINLESEKIAYWQKRKDKRERTMAQIRNSCPVLKVWDTGKAYGKYDFQGVKMQYVSNDGLIITWEFDGCGSIGRTYGYDYTKADRLANSLDGLKEG